MNTNNTSGWTVTRTTSSATQSNADYLSLPYDGTPTTKAAVLITADPNWTASNDSRLSSAKWISDSASSGSSSGDPFSTRYVYKASFTLAQASNLKAVFAADNIVDKVIFSSAADGAGTVFGTFTNAVLPIGDQDSGPPGRIYGFRLDSVQSLNLTASGTVFVTATSYNYSGPPVAGHPVSNGSSYGFIMSVDATAVPEPVSAAILGVPAALLLLRRRKS